MVARVPERDKAHSLRATVAVVNMIDIAAEGMSYVRNKTHPYVTCLCLLLCAISPVRCRLRGNYDKTLENPGLIKSCPTFAPASPIFAASLQDVKSPVQQPSATSMADIRSLNNVCLENAFRSADIRLNVEATVRDHTLETHVQ